MKLKNFALVFIIAIATIGYLAYPIIKNRYFHADQNKDNSQEQNTTNNSDEQSSANDSQNTSSDASLMNNNGTDKSESDALMSNSNKDSANLSDAEKKFLSGEKTETPKSTAMDIDERNIPDGKTLAHITTEHCKNNCKSFSIDTGLLEYCHQVCGIAQIKEVSSCDDKKNIEKDYCLKDLAITKKDSSLCNKIEDANIKLTCKNRILQDIVEGQ